MNVLIAAVALGGLGLAFGIILSVAFNRLAVEIDPREAEILELLPGANCGACGFPGCQGLAEALAKGKAEANACVAGGPETVKKIARILGVEIEPKAELVAFVACRAGAKQAALRIARQPLFFIPGTRRAFTDAWVWAAARRYARLTPSA